MAEERHRLVGVEQLGNVGGMDADTVRTPVKGTAMAAKVRDDPAPGPVGIQQRQKAVPGGAVAADAVHEDQERAVRAALLEEDRRIVRRGFLLPRQLREHRPGLVDHVVDHLAGGNHLENQAGALARRQHAVIDVPLDPAALGGLMADM